MPRTHKKKVDAIYELREAAEEKGRAEEALGQKPSPEKRDALLDAAMTLEEKTVTALEACHDCGHEHAPDMPHAANVVHVDFDRKTGAD